MAITVKSFVTGGIGTTGASTFTSATFATATGDSIIWCMRSGAASMSNVSSVTDVVGNTYIPLTQTFAQENSTCCIQFWYCLSSIGSSSVNAVTVNFSTSTPYCGMGCWDVSGLTGVDTSHSSAVTSGTTTESITTGTVTTSTPNTIVFSFVGWNGVPITSAISSGWTLSSGTIWPSAHIAGAGYQIFSSTQAGSTGATWTQSNSSVLAVANLAVFTAPSSGGISTVLAPAPIPATVANSSGYSWPITSPTLGNKLGQPTPVVFCDANGNELTVTGSTKGAFIAGALPVVLCDSIGHPLAAPFVFTSNGNSITVSATPTGIKLGQPIPVVATDFNGFPYILSGFTLGSMAGNPTAICLTDVNGNVLTLSGIAT